MLEAHFGAIVVDDDKLVIARLVFEFSTKQTTYFSHALSLWFVTVLSCRKIIWVSMKELMESWVAAGLSDKKSFVKNVDLQTVWLKVVNFRKQRAFQIDISYRTFARRARCREIDFVPIKRSRAVSSGGLKLPIRRFRIEFDFISGWTSGRHQDSLVQMTTFNGFSLDASFVVSSVTLVCGPNI